MKKLVLGMIIGLMNCSTTWAQEENLFTWKDKTIVPNSKFINNEQTPLPKGLKIYDYAHTKRNIPSPNEKYKYEFIQVGYNKEEIDYDVFEGFSIICNGKKILTYWAEAMWRVSYLTMNKDDKRKFLCIPLDEESFALIIGGWVFSGDIDAGEMVIVCVSKNEAKVVYDAHAFAYKYTPAPKFAIEFTEKIKELLDKEGYVYDFAADTSKKNWKHKIWKEGNILKYKKWK